MLLGAVVPRQVIEKLKKGEAFLDQKADADEFATTGAQAAVARQDECRTAQLLLHDTCSRSA